MATDAPAAVFDHDRHLLAAKLLAVGGEGWLPYDQRTKPNLNDGDSAWVYIPGQRKVVMDMYRYSPAEIISPTESLPESWCWDGWGQHPTFYKACTRPEPPQATL